MKILFTVIVSLLLSINAFASDDAADQANRAKFEKECAALIAPGGPCGEVKAGGGGRRGCVSQPENLAQATPECKAVIEEWQAMKK